MDLMQLAEGLDNLKFTAYLSQTVTFMAIYFL